MCRVMTVLQHSKKWAAEFREGLRVQDYDSLTA